jgi:hypothetical protein
MLPLSIHAKDAAGSAAFRFDAIKSAVATDVEHALSGQVRGQTLPDDFPGLARVIDGFAHHALGFGEYSTAEIDLVKPGLEHLQSAQDFVAHWAG